MANKEKHDILKNKKETKEEFEYRICKQMQAGFKWSTESWSILQIFEAVRDELLEDPNYQRGIVWDNYKNKALIDTIIMRGGNKIPTLTFRRLDNGKYEIVDGKQRIKSAIYPFVKNEFALNGVYNPELKGYTLNDIKEQYPQIYGAFMSTTIQVQIATDMSYDEAVTYFIQINESGVNMRTGEKIHAKQGTPLVESIDSLRKHKVWDNVQRVSRFNDYTYISRMLLFVRDQLEDDDTIKVYTNTQLMKELEQYYVIDVPNSNVNRVKKTFTALQKVFSKNNICLNITEFFSVFVYAYKYLDQLNLDSFGEFIKGLYKNIRKNPKGVFRVIKYQNNQIGYDFTSKYYMWYISNLNFLYGKFLEGAKWNEIQELRLKN